MVAKPGKATIFPVDKYLLLILLVRKAIEASSPLKAFFQEFSSVLTAVLYTLIVSSEVAERFFKIK
jgi:uncharacterized MnhB-related membrane protein